MKGVDVGVLIIKFSVSNQRLRRITSGIIPSNAYGKLKFEFDFRTDDWDVVENKTANFYYKGKNHRIKLDKYNQCFVPQQVIHSPSFSVSIDGGDLTTNSITNYVIEDQGASTTPDIDNDDFDSNDINIFDGGVIILDLTNDPDEEEPDSPEPQSVVEYIMENRIPFYSGLVGTNPSEVKYQHFDSSIINYTDQCFYTTTNNDDQITNAGYQITFIENMENVAQTFSIYSNAKIVTAYQYHSAFNQWINVGFDGTYWVEVGTMTKIINGQQITYTTYAYNVELMGDAITAPEYWRFEVEVS